MFDKRNNGNERADLVTSPASTHRDDLPAEITLTLIKSVRVWETWDGGGPVAREMTALFTLSTAWAPRSERAAPGAFTGGHPSFKLQSTHHHFICSQCSKRAWVQSSVIIKGFNAFGLVGPRENSFIASRLQIDHVGVGLYWPYHQHRHPSLTAEGSERPRETVRVMHCHKNTRLMRHAETPRGSFVR